MTKTNKRRYRRIDILSLVIGSIIGWGSFTLPGQIFLPKSGVLNTVTAFFIGGFSVLLILLAYHRMLEEQNEDGGEFSYAYRHMGKLHGFIVGWGLVLCYLSIVPLNATAFVLAFKTIFGEAINFVYLYSIAGEAIYLSDILLASAVLLLFALINLRGVKMSALVQNILILFLVANVIILFSILLGKADLSLFSRRYVANRSLEWSGVARVLAIAPFLFVGFDVIPQVMTDLGFPRKKAARIAVLGIISGVLVYSLLTMMTALTVGPQEAATKNWALGEGILAHVGSFGFFLLIVALFAAVSSGINGFMVGSSRLLGAMADYGMIPPRYSAYNEKGVRHRAIYFLTAVSLIAPWFGRPVITYIVDMSSLMAAVAYFYVCFIALRRSRKGMLRVLFLLGTVMSVLFILLLLLPFSPAFLSSNALIFLSIWLLLGIFYYFCNRKRMVDSALLK